MTGEELEISITQYLDGTLPAEQRAALEAVLATDTSARALLEEHRRLDAAMRSAMPMPQIDWENLGRRISDAVADAPAAAPAYSISWQRPVAWLAAAACLLIACGVALQLLRPGSSTMNPVNPGQTAVISVAEVNGPQIEKPAGPQVVEFSLGPAPVAGMENYPSAEGVVAQPSEVSIASAASGGHWIHR